MFAGPPLGAARSRHGTRRAWLALCVETLEEEIGEIWRDEAEQRLGGENQDDE